MANSKERSDDSRGEAGYSWLYNATVLNGGTRATVTILVIALGAGSFAWYSRSGIDSSPDSPMGLAYATIGTMLLLLAATLYSLRRRSHRRRTLGGLRTSLGWHICFALMGLAFLGMHSFGELNPRTGTYALYGMIALVISGLIGRGLDRLLPRLTASEVHKALTAGGDDRIETISEKLQAIVKYNTQQVRGFAPQRMQQNAGNRSLVSVPAQGMQTQRGQTLHTPWDLGYISLESTPQELSRETGQFRLVPDKKSAFLDPGVLMPGSQEQASELEEVQQAMKRELFYRHMTRSWRTFHVLLALVTVGLLVWHIVFALQLWLPTLPH